MPLPFEDSRRLTGANLYFTEPGAVLETLPDDSIDDAFVALWRERVAFARNALGWQQLPIVARVQAGGCAFALAAPVDQLFVATEVNEWAFVSAMFSFSPREKVPHLQLKMGQMRERIHRPLQVDTQSGKLPFDKETLAFVRSLRSKSTNPEQLIWSLLRDRRLHGQKFRRQHAVGPYVLDFYCHDLKLAIELDGSQHNELAAQKHDAQRDEFLSERGIETLRYWNNDVLERTENVLTDIWNRVEELSGVSANRSALPSSAPSSIEDGAPSPDGRREDLFYSPAFPSIWDDDLAMRTLCLASAAERRTDLMSLLDEARRRELPFQLDDSELTLGAGAGARTWPLDALPAVDSIDWTTLHGIPVALVTGSNGKTTTTRLVAAMSELHGTRTAFSCTDGVFVEGHPVASGDYSGPAGARTALRQPLAEAAILETARGGILRRGLAVNRADAAIVTNISADHFGEYGIRDLDGLADTKLVVARVLAMHRTLVLNADDETLVRRAATLSCRLAWFALDVDHPLLVAHRARGGATCGVRDGQLILHCDGNEHALGRIADMPLTMRGAATYNIANIAGAALLASALDIPVQTIASVLAHFGSDNADNPGRLMRWSFGTSIVLLDYAHNPEGLRGLLEVARALSPGGRLAIVLGQAGNREDADIRELAVVAARRRPELVVLKELASLARGRTSGEVVALLQNELLRSGVAANAILISDKEIDAARIALEWARDGDLLVLPIHDKQGRAGAIALLDRLTAMNWKPGQALPPGIPA